MKQFMGFIMIIMIIIFGISIEKDISVENNENPYAKYINYNMSTNPENLKLTDSLEVRDKDLLVNLFQGLVKENEEGQIVGALAKEITVSDDGIEYNFKLRSDIYYSNGDKITPQEFFHLFKALLDDKNNIYVNDLDFIYGAKEYREGRCDFSQVAIIAKEDTLTIRLNSPCSYFLEILAHPIYALRDYNDLNEYKANYKNIRYTGPYVIRDISKEDIILSKNINYYKASEVTNEGIRISFIESPEDALAIFEASSSKVNNKVDLMMDVPVNEVYRLKKQNSIKEFQGNEMISLNFNNKEESISGNSQFRIAIKDIIDREKYSAMVSDSLLNPIYSIAENQEETINVFKSQNKINSLEFFKQLSKGNTNVRVIYEDKSLQRRVAKELCENLTAETEVEFVPIGLSTNDLQEALEKQDYDIYMNIFQGKYNLAFEYLNEKIKEQENITCDNIMTNTNYIDNQEERKPSFIECEQILSEDLQFIPIYRVNNIVCHKNNFTGFYVDKRGNIDLENIKRVR